MFGCSAAQECALQRCSAARGRWLRVGVYLNLRAKPELLRFTRVSRLSLLLLCGTYLRRIGV